MSINYSQNDFAEASDLEERAIYEEAETVKVRKSHGTNKRLHIFDCDYLKDKNTAMVEKDIAVYPRGFCEICTICLKHYRDGREL